MRRNKPCVNGSVSGSGVTIFTTASEGVALGIVVMEGCERLEIVIDREVWNGQEIPAGSRGSRIGRHVYPPLNGTLTTSGLICYGIELITNEESKG